MAETQEFTEIETLYTKFKHKPNLGRFGELAWGMKADKNKAEVKKGVEKALARIGATKGGQIVLPGKSTEGEYEQQRAQIIQVLKDCTHKITVGRDFDGTYYPAKDTAFTPQSNSITIAHLNLGQLRQIAKKISKHSPNEHVLLCRYYKAGIKFFLTKYEK